MFRGGATVLHWIGAVKSTAVYRAFGEMESIHGHDGTEFHLPGIEIGQRVDVVADGADHGKGTVTAVSPGDPSHPIQVKLDNSEKSLWFMTSEVLS